MHPATVLVIGEPGAKHFEELKTVLPPPTTVIVGNDLTAVRAAAGETDVILNGIPDARLLRAVFTEAKQLRWVHSLSAGVEKILFPELRESPVILTNARGVFKGYLAEFVIAAALFFAKDLRRLVRSQEAGTWDQFDMDELFGKVMGIVGYGETGTACAERAHALGMKVLGLRRRPELSSRDPLSAALFGPEHLHELLKQCDYVVLTAPSTPQTWKLFGKAEFAAMKATAIFINVARGSLVDEPALIDALDSGRIRGAALDVFETEPLPPGHPFFRLKNLLLSPHCADHVRGFWELGMDLFIRNFKRFIKGQLLENLVNKEAGY